MMVSMIGCKAQEKEQEPVNRRKLLAGSYLIALVIVVNIIHVAFEKKFLVIPLGKKINIPIYVYYLYCLVSSSGIRFVEGPARQMDILCFACFILAMRVDYVVIANFHRLGAVEQVSELRGYRDRFPSSSLPSWPSNF